MAKSELWDKPKKASDTLYLSVIKMDKGGWSIVKANTKTELLKGGRSVAKADNKYDASKALQNIKRRAEKAGKKVKIIAM